MDPIHRATPAPEDHPPLQPPFWIIVFADLAGDPQEPRAPVSSRALVDVDRHTIDANTWHFAAGLKVHVQNVLTDDGSYMAIDLAFKSIADFEADSLVAQIPALRHLREMQIKLHWLLHQLQSDTPVAFIADLMFDYGLLPQDEVFSRDDIPSMLDEVIHHRDHGTPPLTGERLLQSLRHRLTFSRRIELEAAIDAVEDPVRLDWLLDVLRTLSWRCFSRLHLLSTLGGRISAAMEAMTVRIDRQLDVVVRDPKFRSLANSWRGLHYLVGQVKPGANVRISAFDISNRELRRLCYRDTLSREAWQRMRKVWGASKLVDLHDESDWQDLPIAAGNPISLLVVDHGFGFDMDDLLALERVAAFASRLQAPVIANLACDATAGRSPTPTYEAAAVLRRLAAFRVSDEANYLVLTAPAFLPRAERFPAVDSDDQDRSASVSDTPDESAVRVRPAVAAAAKVARSVAGGHWLAADELSASTSTHVQIARQPDARLRKLLRYGVAIPVPATPETCPEFLSAPVMHLPDLNRTQTDLRHIILASRMAHNLRRIARQQATSDAKRLQVVLQAWIDRQVPCSFQSARPLLAEPSVQHALIRVRSPEHEKKYYKGFLREVRYFDATLLLRFQHDGPGLPTSINLPIALYRHSAGFLGA